MSLIREWEVRKHWFSRQMSENRFPRSSRPLWRLPHLFPSVLYLPRRFSALALNSSGSKAAHSTVTSLVDSPDHADHESGLGFSPSPVVAELSRMFGDVLEIRFLPPRISTEISSLFKFLGHSLCLCCTGKGCLSFPLTPLLSLFEFLGHSLCLCCTGGHFSFGD